jgi:hypothetical protein
MGEERIGQVLRGQGWVELHGEFTAGELRSLADLIEAECKGLEANGGKG